MAAFKAIDLFAGIGGIRLGFEHAFGDDLETVFVSEFDRYAARTQWFLRLTSRAESIPRTYAV